MEKKFSPSIWIDSRRSILNSGGFAAIAQHSWDLHQYPNVTVCDTSCLQNLNHTYDSNVPLVLMNSFNTHDDTLKVILPFLLVQTFLLVSACEIWWCFVVFAIPVRSVNSFCFNVWAAAVRNWVCFCSKSGIIGADCGKVQGFKTGCSHL
jgi:hypothetical protein